MTYVFFARARAPTRAPTSYPPTSYPAPLNSPHLLSFSPLHPNSNPTIASSPLIPPRGANLERLTALKGVHCAERALYVRLQARRTHEEHRRA